MVIDIHWDYTSDTDVSYIEGLESLKNNKDFTTCCLEFIGYYFSLEQNSEIIIRKKNGNYIIVSELYSNTDDIKKKYKIQKEIRAAHNIKKMIIAGSISFAN